MNAAEEARAKRLLRTAAIEREIDVERRDKDQEIVALSAELAQERRKVADLQALLDRYQAKQRILREETSVTDAHWYRVRDLINSD